MAQDSSFSSLQSIFDNGQRFDIFISYDRKGPVSILDNSGEVLTTEAFVKNYLVPALKDRWEDSNYEGTLNIFDGEVYGNLESSISSAIAGLQVVYD